MKIFLLFQKIVILFVIFVKISFLSVFSYGQDKYSSHVIPASEISKLISPEVDTHIQKGLDHFRRKMDAGQTLGDGGFQDHPAIIALVGMAFLSAGSTPMEGEDAKYVAKCVEMLLSQARVNGVIAREGISGQSLMYGNGFALTFLAECYGMSSEDEKIRVVIQKSVEMLIRAQNEEGGWRYTPTRSEADVSVTACVVMAFRAARNAGFSVSTDVMKKAEAYIRRCQNHDGGYRYRGIIEGESAFPRTAAALAALCAAGHYRGEDLRKGLLYLQNSACPTEDGYYFYAHYYAVQAFWLYQDEENKDEFLWQKWYSRVRDELLSLQKPDGTWISTISLDHATAMALIVLQVPNHSLPILQR
ncbi:MAG: terpene cyclase/mutase family protein [Planctomycetia bacterium]|nr:terpene cyclase/mutase family protein [Planctomycetia bacterium]